MNGLGMENCAARRPGSRRAREGGPARTSVYARGAAAAEASAWMIVACRFPADIVMARGTLTRGMVELPNRPLRRLLLGTVSCCPGGGDLSCRLGASFGQTFREGHILRMDKEKPHEARRCYLQLLAYTHEGG
jgi:hypothetical protein